METKSLQKIAAVAGVLSIVFYFSSAVISFLPDWIVRLLGFSFPLLWIIAFMGMFDFLKRENKTATLEIGYLFGIIGASIAAAFIVVQQANFMWHDAAMELAGNEETIALAKATFKGANRVQAGLDVSFDIFITISWILFGINIAGSKSFNKYFGWIGSIIALILLVLNLITFPDPPASSGLFDAGPFLALWTLIFYVWFAILVFRKAKL